MFIRMYANIRDDASVLFARSLNLPPQGFYTREQKNYINTLRAMAGKDIPALSDHEVYRGIKDHVYFVHPAVDEYGNRLQSRIVAVHRDMVVNYALLYPFTEVPISTDHPQYKMFKEKEGMLTIRILTPWVDGFTAFVKET